MRWSTVLSSMQAIPHNISKMQQQPMKKTIMENSTGHLLAKHAQDEL